MQITKLLFGLALALIVTATSVAQDDEKKQDEKSKKATARAIKSTTNQMMKAFAKANLTDEQKEKAAAIVKKHIEALLEARKAQDALLTEDQKKSRTEAIAKAKEDGAKGNEFAAIGTKAMGLSEDKLKEYSAARKKVNEVNAKMKEAITALLTDEQQALMPKKKAKRGAKGAKKGKKKKAGEDDSDDGSEKTQTVSLKLPGMICGGCAASVATALKGVEGIADIKTDVETRSCTFTAPGKLNVKAMLDKFAEGGNKQIEGWSVSKGVAY